LEIDLSTYSLKDLKELQSRVAKEIAGFEARKKNDALLMLEEKAKELGFTLAELTGRKPRWFVAALAAGKTPEQLSI
jgi:DNA-binding protein H-NS